MNAVASLPRRIRRGLAPLAILPALATVALGGTLATPETVSGQRLLQSPADRITYPRGDVFIQGLDRIWTANGEVLENASILIRNGIIEAIGPDLEAPAGVRVVNGVGRTAIPGIVDEHSHTAMIGTNEGSAPIVPEVRVLDAVDPTDYGIFRALSGGVTTARLMHGSSNPIGGQSAVIKMRWGMDEAEQMLVPGAPRAVKFALGENVTRKSSQTGANMANRRFPASRQGVEALYVQAFTAAQEYRAVWEAYRANPSAFAGPPRRDLRLEALVDIMEDRILIHAHSYRSDEILMLMRVAERFGFTIDAFTHILEGYRVADELREHGAGASTFSDWWQFKLEAYDAIPHNAAILADRGVLTAINSDISWLQTFMNWEIAKPVQYGGAPKEEALRMLTLNPAIMLGVEDKVGSLQVGKHGDVVLLTGDPFDSFSRVEKTFIEGVLYFDSEDEETTRGEPFHRLPTTPATRFVADATRVGGAPGLGGSTPGAQVAPADLPVLNTRAEAVALVGGTIHPVTAAPIENGVLLLEGGRIQAMGPRGSVEIPAGVRQVDVSGRHLYPGMIDPVTHLGIFEFGQVPQATDRSEVGRFNPHIRSLGAYQPHGRAPFVARARGITSALVAQSGGVIEGMGSVVNLEGDTFERAGIRGEGALMVNLPVPTNPPGGTSTWDVFSDLHGHARDIVWAGEALLGGGHAHVGGELAWDHYDGAAWASDMAGGPRGLSFVDLTAQQFRGRGAGGQAAGGSREPSLETGQLQELVDYMRRAQQFLDGGATVAQRPDAPFEANVWGGDRVALEAMAPVLRGEIPVFFRADSDWQIRHVFLLAEAFPAIRPVIVGGVQAFRVADELAERGIPVILTRTRSPTPDRNDSYAASFRNAAILHQAGVRFAFGTDESADVRNLPEHVAVAISHGLPAEVGYEAVTIRAAEILGLGDLMGSLEAGKRADILVTDGHPLQALTRIETMFIGGIQVDPRDNDHDRAFERFRDRR